MTAKKALIIGASRGLGLGLVKELLADGWDVTATVRHPQKADALKALGPVRIEQLDMNNQQAIKALGNTLHNEVFDLLFINAGVKGPEDQLSGNATLAEVGQLFFTNSVAPITLAQAFVEQGWTAIRFNMRGVGKTEGVYDDGIGEADDLLAIIEQMAPTGALALALGKVCAATPGASRRTASAAKWISTSQSMAAAALA